MGRLTLAFGAPFAARLHPAGRPMLTALVGLVAFATWLGGPSHAARACPVVIPTPSLLSPGREAEAPLNARVRVELPVEGLYGGGPESLRLRSRGADGEVRNVGVQARVVGAARGKEHLVELTPDAPLAPSTRYEVVLVRSEPQPPHPRLVVFGAFRTGSAVDATPPRLERVASVHVMPGEWPNCSTDSPQVLLAGVEVGDPGRPKAALLFGVWASDAAGRIDPSRPPDDLQSLRMIRVELPPPPPPPPSVGAATTPGAVAPPEPAVAEVSLLVGRRTSCERTREFVVPDGPASWVGVAPIDEAGNVGALYRVPTGATGPVP
ncbi:MAG TPA: hypothetical protein VFS00_26030 [Polyangiaceae bacterium]|nr:hypothetical protein [Polyangiaceae bacterium]